MSRKNKLSLVGQIKARFDSRLAIGRSKHIDKLYGATQNKIYSWETYRSYMKHANYFAKWCKENYGCKTLEQCRPYVDEWLTKRGELAASTQKLEASALAKLYGCSSTAFVKTKSRLRADIVRSRKDCVRDKHFSETRNKNLVDFCRSTGLRRAEVTALTGDKLIYKNNNPYVRINSASKGGRYREVPVIGNVSLVETLMKKAGSGKVFEKVSKNADIHSYRSDYATALYKQYARPINEIPYDRLNRGTGRWYQSEVYVCRGDRAGIKYDKQAMLIVSNALGHNRLSVIAGHYLQDI